METIFQKKELMKGLKILLSIKGKKRYPVLENVIILAQNNGVKLQATDLKSSLTYTISPDNAEIAKEGILVISAPKLQNLLKKIKDSEVSLKSGSGNPNGIIGCQTGKFTLLGVDPNKFPVIPDFKEEAEFCILNCKELQKLIKKTLFATTTEKTRYDLDNVLVIIESGRIRFVSTDGKRLALCECKLQENTMQEEKKITVPAKGLQQIDKVIGATSPENVKISIQENQLLFQTPEVVFSTRLSEGRFPPYEGVIPKNLTSQAIVPKKEFLSALEQAKLFADKSHPDNPFRLSFEKDNLKIQTCDKMAGSANLEIPIVFEEENFEEKDFKSENTRTFNIDFFIEGLKKIDFANIKIFAKNGTSPVLIKEGNNFQYIVLPLKVDPIKENN